MRFDAGPDAAGARHNTGTQFRDIGLAALSGHRNRVHAPLAAFRQLGQMRFDAGLDPAFAGRDAGAKFLDIANEEWTWSKKDIQNTQN